MDERNYELISLLSETNERLSRQEIIRNYLKEICSETNAAITDFESDLEWFNVKAALSLRKDLQGKLVVLDFFTYCCINCMHILPDLEELEEKFKITDGVVVVGVHSAKFENEKLSANILSAIRRYGITHPVVNDHDAVMWNELNIQCWPTQLVLGPKNQILVSMVGEGHRQNMLDFIEVAIEFYTEKGLLETHDIELELCKNSTQSSPLQFPGKVAISRDGTQIAISDTGHHRVLVCDKNGVIQYKIGCGKAGLENGSLKQARFRAPQGVCWDPDGSLLYVADTENHVVRKVDLKEDNVSTLTGTGVQGADKIGGATGDLQEISSPWDLTLGRSPGSSMEDVLLIAMAGTHQIWMYCLSDVQWWKNLKYPGGTCVCIAGSGNEENRNNNYPLKASFAQPSGVCLANFQVTKKTFGKPAQVEETPHMVIADSESSSIRSVNLRDGSVKAVVGGQRDPNDLFAYGDVDGNGYDTKLQHPLGVAVAEQEPSIAYVADSYNHKIKKIDLNTKECVTVIGSAASIQDSKAVLNEPAGLCFHSDGQQLFIADTNNHAVKVYDTKSGQVTQFAVIDKKDVADGLKNTPITRTPPTKTALKSIVNKRAQTINGKPVIICPGDQFKFYLEIKMADTLHFTSGAPSACQMFIPGETNDNIRDLPQKCVLSEQQSSATLAFHVPENYQEQNINIRVECSLFYCDDAGVCMNKGYAITIPISIVTSQTHDQNITSSSINKQERVKLSFSNDHPSQISDIQLAKVESEKQENTTDTTDSHIVTYSMTITVPKAKS